MKTKADKSLIKKPAKPQAKDADKVIPDKDFGPQMDKSPERAWEAQSQEGLGGQSGTYQDDMPMTARDLEEAMAGGSRADKAKKAKFIQRHAGNRKLGELMMREQTRPAEKGESKNAEDSAGEQEVE